MNNMYKIAAYMAATGFHKRAAEPQQPAAIPEEEDMVGAGATAQQLPYQGNGYGTAPATSDSPVLQRLMQPRAIGVPAGYSLGRLYGHKF